MQKDENGYIVVETLLAFILYLFAVFSILTLINVTVVQSRVHYAVTEACETVSMYCYLLEATGQAEHLKNQAAAADETAANINEVVDNINTIISSAGNFDYNGVKGGISGVQAGVDKFEVHTVLAALMQNVQNAVFAQALKGLSGHYLDNGIASDGSVTQRGEDYLKAFGVEDGLNFMGTYGVGFQNYQVSVQLGTDGSTLLNANGEVVAAVHYKVNYKFGALELPFDALEIRQIVKTKAWLNGAGTGYAK